MRKINVKTTPLCFSISLFVIFIVMFVSTNVSSGLLTVQKSLFSKPLMNAPLPPAPIVCPAGQPNTSSTTEIIFKTQEDSGKKGFIKSGGKLGEQYGGDSFDKFDHPLLGFVMFSNFSVLESIKLQFLAQFASYDHLLVKYQFIVDGGGAISPPQTLTAVGPNNIFEINFDSLKNIAQSNGFGQFWMMAEACAYNSEGNLWKERIVFKLSTPIIGYSSLYGENIDQVDILYTFYGRGSPNYWAEFRN